MKSRNQAHADSTRFISTTATARNSSSGNGAGDASQLMMAPLALMGLMLFSMGIVSLMGQLGF